MTAQTARIHVWVVDHEVNAATLERLGDARRVAEADRVGALIVSSHPVDGQELIRHGADHVAMVRVERDGPRTRLAAAAEVLARHRPRIALLGGDPVGRGWAARLATRLQWPLLSPALMVKRRGARLEVTALDRDGRLSRKVSVEREESAIVTLRPGVAEAEPANGDRKGVFEIIDFAPRAEVVSTEKTIPADPATVDIRFADRLVSGGRGLGGKEGFDALRAFARKLRAGVAASRMAVDLGWIEHDRQVGQTGKTVTPELYIACGISGASHHLEGMSGAKHIIAINTDPQAPIFKTAHLGLVADLYEVLKQAESAIGEP